MGSQKTILFRAIVAPSSRHHQRAKHLAKTPQRQITVTIAAVNNGDDNTPVI